MSRTEKGLKQYAEDNSAVLRAVECCRLALIQHVQDNPAEAIAQYEAALAANPSCEQAYLGVVDVLIAVGHIFRALNYCVRGVQAVPQSLALK